MNFGIAFAPLVNSRFSGPASPWPPSWPCSCLFRAAAARVARSAAALIVLALANPSLHARGPRPAQLRSPSSWSTKARARISATARGRPKRARAAIVEPAEPHSRARRAGGRGRPSRTARPTARGYLPRWTDASPTCPPDRIAGAIMITDGRVHDVPADAGALGFAAPVHALITGNKNERDRRVALIAAPRFGIVGQSQTITYKSRIRAPMRAPPR